MASKPKGAAKAAGKKKNGYEAPKKIKPGTILKDNFKKEWKIGVSIGIGGFGEIYSACPAESKVQKLEDYPYVVKIEPHNNGPLFVEMHFYMRVGKKEDIDAFAKSKHLQYLGMPYLVGSGSEDIEGLKHRFLVMPRYGTDVWKIFLQQDKKFPLHTVYRLGWQLINILEYIHTSTYVHMDIKGANILLGFNKKSGEDQVHLLDFGLACHYNTKEYKSDPKKAHNGTIEYTSRDAHNGVATMRGDLEILAYNLIEWTGAKLPWTASQQILKKPVEVQKMKEDFMKTLDKSLKSAFGSSPVPAKLSVFVKYVQSLHHDTKPDYNKIREMFETGLKELKQKNSGKLEFSSAGSSNAKQVPVTAAKSPQKRSAAQNKGESKRDGKKAKIIAPVDSVSTEDEEEEEQPRERSKRGREPKQYIEVESDSDTDGGDKKKVPKKRSSPRKIQKTPEKDENKDQNDRKKKDGIGKLILKSKAGSSKKTVQLNFDLDISFDSDLVVTVNRKDKKKDKKSDKNEEPAAEEDGAKIGGKVQAGYYKGKFAKTK